MRHVLPGTQASRGMALGRARPDSPILSDVDATPGELLDSGFVFRHQTAADAVDSALR